MRNLKFHAAVTVSFFSISSMGSAVPGGGDESHDMLSQPFSISIPINTINRNESNDTNLDKQTERKSDFLNVAFSSKQLSRFREQEQIKTISSYPEFKKDLSEPPLDLTLEQLQGLKEIPFGKTMLQSKVWVNGPKSDTLLNYQFNGIIWRCMRLSIETFQDYNIFFQGTLHFSIPDKRLERLQDLALALKYLKNSFIDFEAGKLVHRCFWSAYNYLSGHKSALEIPDQLIEKTAIQGKNLPERELMCILTYIQRNSIWPGNAFYYDPPSDETPVSQYNIAQRLRLANKIQNEYSLTRSGESKDMFEALDYLYNLGIGMSIDSLISYRNKLDSKHPNYSLANESIIRRLAGEPEPMELDIPIMKLQASSSIHRSVELEEGEKFDELPED